MLDTSSLCNILQRIYGIDERYLVPLTGSYFIPTIDKNEPIGTWIGYKMMEKKPIVRAYEAEKAMVLPIRVKWRMSFVGPQAEELADATMLWDVRTDVIDIFGEYLTQLNYIDRTIFTVPWKNEGYNDDLCWVVDMQAQTTYEIPLNHSEWKLKPWEPPDGSWLPKPGKDTVINGEIIIGGYDGNS